MVLSGVLVAALIVVIKDIDKEEKANEKRKNR